MKRNWKKMALAMVLTGTATFSTLTAEAGNPGGSGGSRGGNSSSHSMQKFNGPSNGGMNFSNKFNSQMPTRTNTAPFQNIQGSNHSNLKHNNPVFINNGKNTGIAGGLNSHQQHGMNPGNHGVKNTGIPMNHLNGSQHSHGQHNSGVLHNGQHNHPLNQVIKKIDPGFGNGHNHNGHNLNGNHSNHNNNHFHGNGSFNSNHHHHKPAHFCGKNPAWNFNCSWWYPQSNFCRFINSGYCNPIVPVNMVTVVEPVTVFNNGPDLVLETVGTVDFGNPAAGLGPNYRVTIRNNSPMHVGQFNVLLMTGMDQTPRANSPSTVVQLDGMQSGQVATFDVRLPATALMMAQDVTGQPIPFTNLFVAVDSGEEVQDINRSNNGAVMVRTEIPGVLR